MKTMFVITVDQSDGDNDDRDLVAVCGSMDEAETLAVLLKGWLSMYPPVPQITPEQQCKLLADHGFDVTKRQADPVMVGWLKARDIHSAEVKEWQLKCPLPGFDTVRYTVLYEVPRVYAQPILWWTDPYYKGR